MTSFRKHQLAGLIVALFTAGVPAASHAQLLEDVDAEVVSAEKGAELRIRFNVPVQYLRHSPLGQEPADSVAIYFRVISTETLVPTETDESKKLKPLAEGPQFSILVPRIDNPLAEARVILKFDKPIKFNVRSGADNRSIILELPTVQSRKPADKPAIVAPAPVTAPTLAVAPAPAAPQEAAQAASGVAVAPIEAVAAIPAAESKAPDLAPLGVQTSGLAEIEAQAKVLYDKAKAALDGSNLDVAIETFNQLLNMPPNAQSRSAQELVGVAREKNGDLAKAKAEYSLFVQIYPQGADTDRVKQRLADLDSRTTQTAAVAATQPKAPAKRPPRPERPPEATIYGGISSYFHWGATKLDVADSQAGTTTPTDLCDPAIPSNAKYLNSSICKEKVDQYAWINSFDINYRYRSSKWDNKLVLRDTDTYDTLGRSRNLLNALYGELRNREHDWLVRAGRQSVGQYSITGIMNRFDGVLAGWGVKPKVRINAAVGNANTHNGKPILAEMVGKSYTTYSYNLWSQPFAAVSVDFGPYQDALSGSVYYIDQKADGYTSRQAVGGELRYFKPRFNAFSLLDYDTYFKTLNIFMLQGNYIGQDGAPSYNFLYDRRRSPMMQITNAFQVSELTSSLDELVAASSIEQIKRNALQATSISESLSVGVNKQINPKLQVGGDVRASRMLATPAVPSLTCPLGSTDPACGATEKPAVAATGWDFSYGIQMVGSSLWFENDVAVFSLNYLDSQSFYGLSPSVSYRMTREKWTYDGSLRIYHQRMSDVDSDSTTLRWSPTFRVSYKLKDNFTLEGETGIEYSTDTNNYFDTSTSTSTDTTRKYFTLGLRWNF